MMILRVGYFLKCLGDCWLFFLKCEKLTEIIEVRSFSKFFYDPSFWWIFSWEESKSVLHIL